MPTEIQTPFGIFEVNARAVDLGEVHTVMTREQMEEYNRSRQVAARVQAMKGMSYKLYNGVAAAAKLIVADGETVKIEWTFATDWNSNVIRAYPKLFIQGVDCTYYVDIKEEYTSVSSWRSRPNGKVRVSVGSYGSRTSYPQRKDGTHNYVEIARTLIGIVQGKIAAAKVDASRRSNEQKAQDLRNELNVNDYYGAMRITASADKTKPVFVKVELQKTMTEDEARALHAALKILGLVK